MPVFRGNKITFSLDEGELSKEGQPVELPPIAIALLTYFVERPGVLVEKDDLLENVWQETNKSDEAITAAVHELRVALGDDHRKPAFIKTVSRRGYKFVAEIISIGHEKASAMGPSTSGSSIDSVGGAAGPFVERTGPQRARIHGTKFDVPRRAEFWNSLPQDARQRFRLVGNSNKSWHSLDVAQATALGEAIVRICLSGGTVGILSGTDQQRCIEPMRLFLGRYVFRDRPGETWQGKAARLNALIDRLDYSVVDNINYRAVVSDGRALIIPLLNTSQFRDRSMVIEVTEDDHPAIFETYLGDIDRLRQAAENYFPAKWTEELTGGRLHHVAEPEDLLSLLKALGIVPRDLVLYVTSRCNLRCKHCYVGDAVLQENHMWALKTIRSLIGALELDRLTVVGGEPLLYPGIEEVLRAASASEIAEKRLTTNLTELHDGHIQVIKEAGFRACVSLDGATASQHDAIRHKGQFDKTIANLRLLIANGVDLEVTHSVTAQNVGGFRQLTELLRTIGVRRLNLHKVSPQGNAKLNRHLVMSATDWREFLRDTVFTIPKGVQPLTLRYPLLFATQKEYEQWSEDEGYHHHALGSFYSTHGHRLVLYVDGKVFVSSEAFGTESYVGAIVGGRFEANRTARNEVALSANPLFRVSDVNDEIQGDNNYPVPLSFSYRRTIQL